MSNWAECGLTADRRLAGSAAGGPVFDRIGIVLVGSARGLESRHLRQPIAFAGAVDRNGDGRCIVGGNGTGQCANGARN